MKWPFNITELINVISSLLTGTKDDDFVSPIPEPQQVMAAQQPRQLNNEDYAKIMEMGFNDWGKGKAPPIATASGQLAELGSNLPERYLPAALSLKETGGLSNSETARVNSNPFGIGPGVRYPDLPTAILGGGPDNQRGLKGVLMGREGEPSKYQNYLDSGNLSDFFATYTPDSDPRNPSNAEQVAQMQALLDYFLGAERKYKEQLGY